MTRAAYEASPDQMATDPVTTSAYQVTEYVSGSKIVYKNTGKYWQTDESLVPMTSRHNVENIEIDIIPDTAQLTNALKTRAIDVSVWISATDIADFKDQPGFTVSKMPENTTELFLFNCSEKSVFANNPDLRKAIAYAIDSELIAEALTTAMPVREIPMATPSTPTMWKAGTTNRITSMILRRRRSCMRLPGASNLNLKLMSVTSDETAMMATIIQAELAELGINVELCGYDSQLFNQYKFDGADQWDLMFDEGASSNLANVYKLAWDRNNYTHGGALNYVRMISSEPARSGDERKDTQRRDDERVPPVSEGTVLWHWSGSEAEQRGAHRYHQDVGDLLPWSGSAGRLRILIHLPLVGRRCGFGRGRGAFFHQHEPA